MVCKPRGLCSNTHLCHCNTKAAKDNMKMNGWAVVPIWGTGHRVPTPGTDWLKFFKTEVHYHYYLYTLFDYCSFSQKLFPKDQEYLPSLLLKHAGGRKSIYSHPPTFHMHTHTSLSTACSRSIHEGLPDMVPSSSSTR